MVDVAAKPMIAQQGNIRVDPFVQPSTPVGGLPPSVARTLGPQSSVAKAATDDLTQTGDVTPEDVAHLQDAASKGDKESWDLLNALKLPLGIAAGAAALYGVTRGGLSLVDAVGKAKGLSMVPTGKGVNNAPPVNQKLLSNPIKQITDQTTGKMNQPAPTEIPQLTDQRSIYEKTGGKLPTGAAAGEALREAAKALRRGH